MVLMTVIWPNGSEQAINEQGLATSETDRSVPTIVAHPDNARLLRDWLEGLHDAHP